MSYEELKAEYQKLLEAYQILCEELDDLVKQFKPSKYPAKGS